MTLDIFVHQIWSNLHFLSLFTVSSVTFKMSVNLKKKRVIVVGRFFTIKKRKLVKHLKKKFKIKLLNKIDVEQRIRKKIY